MAAEAEGLFGECTIYFVPSRTLTPTSISELSTLVTNNGAKVCEPRRDGSVPIEEVTHIVSNTIDFPQFIDSQAIMIPVVTTGWITSSVHRRKQANVRPYSPDPRMIFSEVVVTCGDLPVMDKESICGATMALGGQETKDVNRMTTHICTLSMEHPKVQAAKEKGWNGKIVLPHWFDDCFKLGKRIDERPYTLPDPGVLRMTPDPELSIPENDDLNGATSAHPVTPPLPPNSEVVRPPVTVFQDLKVMLSTDLGITTRLEKAIKETITHGGGHLVDSVEACDMFICRYRDGPQYTQAAQSCRHVGSLSWLYYLIIRNAWSSPLRRLLHYPVPRNGIEAFKGLKITVSNYGGEARIYLENLIEASGAEFTKTMKADNTHLITARNTSEKCRAAPEWGIAVVNHLWIEESYAVSDMKPYNLPKYNHFPPRTNLGEIIGQTFLEEARLKDVYYPMDDEIMEGLSPRARKKRKMLDQAGDNAYSQGPAEGVVIGRPNKSREFEVIAAEDKADKRGKKAAADFSTPVKTRRVASGKENETPSVASTGGRSAKSKALDRLHAQAPDIALYEQEKKRQGKGGTTPFGGKRATDQAEKAEKEKADKKKRVSDAALEDEDIVEKRPAKKSRPSVSNSNTRIVLTGYRRWLDNPQKEDKEKRKLKDLGITFVSPGQPCDYLVAPSIVRTVKFLCALARGPTVISSTFLEEALESGEMPVPEDHLLKDESAESKWDIDLEVSAARAKQWKGQLLRGQPIYCTERIKSGPETYKSIAEANGAIFKTYSARSGTTIKPTTAEEDGFKDPEPVYLITTNTPEERPLWPRFRKMAEAGHMEPRVVTTDWLLNVAMAQEMRWDEKYLVENFFEGE